MKTYIYPPQSVAVAVPPIEFLKNGVSVNVEQDTVTPANNNALPSLQFIVKDGVQVPVAKSTGTPANTVGIPVEIVASTGTPINITAGDINVQLTDMGLNPDSVKIGNGTGNYLKVNADGSSDVNIKNSSIPITAASLPLPTGAATEAKQDSLITKVTDIPNVISAEGGVQPSKGIAVLGHTGTGIVRHLRVDNTGIVQVAVNSNVLAADAATATNQATGNSSLSSIDGKLTGVATAANQSTTNTRIGDLTEAAPATDTASSGLNGRLQRIAQRITSLIALFPSTLGQKTMANSFAVTLASDQSSIPTVNQGLTAQFQEIITLTTTAQTFTAPVGSKWCKVYADATNDNSIRVKIGGTATATSGIRLEAGRDIDFNLGGNVSVIAEGGTNQRVNVHFGA